MVVLRIYIPLSLFTLLRWLLRAGLGLGEHSDLIVSMRSPWPGTVIEKRNMPNRCRGCTLAEPTLPVAKRLNPRNRWRVPTNLLLKRRNILAMHMLHSVILAFG